MKLLNVKSKIVDSVILTLREDIFVENVKSMDMVKWNVIVLKKEMT